MQVLLDFLDALGRERIHYILESHRDAVMLVVPSPSQYLEVEFFADGHIELQTFGPASQVSEVTAEDALAVLRTAVNGE